MKLRNKKTGLVGELHYEPDKEYHFTVATDDPADMAIYRTLAELNEEWEDYEPKEPLINDTECRKIMRLWADRCGVKTVTLFGSEFRYGGKSISFGVDFGLEHLKLYTIDELCGEEEE